MKCSKPSVHFTTTLFSHTPEVDAFNSLEQSHFPNISNLSEYACTFKKQELSYLIQLLRNHHLNFTMFYRQNSMSIYRELFPI